MTEDDCGTITLRSKGVSYTGEWDGGDGLVRLFLPGYQIAPMRPLLGKTLEESAEWLLKELIRQIEAGTARKA